MHNFLKQNILLPRQIIYSIINIIISNNLNYYLDWFLNNHIELMNKIIKLKDASISLQLLAANFPEQFIFN